MLAPDLRIWACIFLHLFYIVQYTSSVDCAVNTDMYHLLLLSQPSVGNMKLVHMKFCLFCVIFVNIYYIRVS